MKKNLLKFSKSKWSKVLACCLICTVFISIFAISSSAVTSFDTVNFYFSFYQSKGTVYNYDNDTTLYSKGVTSVSSVNFNNVVLSPLYEGGADCFYYLLSIECNFSSLKINGVFYDASLGAYLEPELVPRSGSYSISGVASYYKASVTYRYLFAIPAFDIDSYNDNYLSGFTDGVNSEASKDRWYPQGFEDGVLSSDAEKWWYPKGFDAGYAAGLADGLKSSESQSFGENLIGDTLSAPIRAINSITLYTAPNGVAITLGSVLGALIGLSLFLGFLKMFGG